LSVICHSRATVIPSATPPATPSTMRILSIQSGVAHGYVGNRAATFPLQLLHHEVDVVNTVQLSSSTAYPRVQGFVLSPEQVEQVAAGLEGEQHYDALLSGYVPGRDGVRALGRIAQRVSKGMWLLDPVMGDHGRMYVDQDVVEEYRLLCHQADIITPNGYEAGLLLKRTLATVEEAARGAEELSRMFGVDAVVTSVEADTRIYIAGRQRDADATFVYAVQRQEANFQGTGDLFSALVLAHRSEGLEAAVVKSLASVAHIIRQPPSSVFAGGMEMDLVSPAGQEAIALGDHVSLQRYIEKIS